MASLGRLELGFEGIVCVFGGLV